MDKLTPVVVISSATGVIVESPYCPEFVDGARTLNGSWDKRTWTFDVRDEERVRALCVSVYGTDGSDADKPTLTIHVPLQDKDGWAQAVYVSGHRLAFRLHRDDRPRLPEGVRVIAGGFAPSGGSNANPRLEVQPGTVLEWRDVAQGTALKTLAERPGATLVDGADNARTALEDERSRLLARLAEIDEQLKKLA